jgi:hypothetical protein
VRMLPLCYLLSGRHAAYISYEALDKSPEQAIKLARRQPAALLNVAVTSDHNSPPP